MVRVKHTFGKALSCSSITFTQKCLALIIGIYKREKVKRKLLGIHTLFKIENITFAFHLFVCTCEIIDSQQDRLEERSAVFHLTEVSVATILSLTAPEKAAVKFTFCILSKPNKVLISLLVQVIHWFSRSTQATKAAIVVVLHRIISRINTKDHIRKLPKWCLCCFTDHTGCG